MMMCYNLSGELEDDDELRNVNIPESERSCGVTAPDIPMELMNQPLRIRKIDIGTVENPKFANVGDYWDEETMAKITDLQHEFQDLFPTKFYEMKGIVGDLGEMKIPLNPYGKPVRKRPYHFNP